MTRLEEFHRLRVIETDDCVEWPYGRSPDGYGMVRYEGRSRTTHRLALVLASGVGIDYELHAVHGPCHNRACMNVSHLRWATNAENMCDKYRDDTILRGERNVCAKLTESDVLTIRASTESYRAVARQFGITVRTAWLVRNRRTWTHV